MESRAKLLQSCRIKKNHLNTIINDFDTFQNFINYAVFEYLARKKYGKKLERVKESVPLVNDTLDAIMRETKRLRYYIEEGKLK